MTDNDFDISVKFKEMLTKDVLQSASESETKTSPKAAVFD